MMLKKAALVAGAISLAVVSLGLAGCAGTKGAVATGEMPNESNDVTHKNIDWKGAEVGVQLPQWVQDALVGDYRALTRLPQFEDKVIVFAEDQGKNLDLLKSWVNNFDVQGTVSRRIRNIVQATFGGAQDGDKDSESSQSYVEEIVSTFSKAEISGLSRELDFWVKTRAYDRSNKAADDVYHYYVVYAIDKDILQEQIDAALGRVDAANAGQQQVKDDVRKAMAEVQMLAE